ncbi:MAG: FHA domain-containing protein [Actinocatenispora sp.]
MSDDSRVRAGLRGPEAPETPIPGLGVPTVAQRWDETTPLDLRALRNAERDEYRRSDPTDRDAGEAQLISVRGPDAGTRYTLETEAVSIGRNEESDIQLDDVTVSRQHAQVQRTGSRFSVADMGSMNGTYVNQERVERVTLEDDDEIQIGRFRLVFRAAS